MASYQHDTLHPIMKPLLTAISTLLTSGSLLGCGGHPDCSTYAVLSAGPETATANHSAKAPGNTTLFQAAVTQKLVHTSSSCALPALSMIVQPNWTVSDPSKATISSAKDATNGLATCLAASITPITVTATDAGTSATLTATATLTCQ
jgi:hypothetical protein